MQRSLFKSWMSRGLQNPAMSGRVMHAKCCLVNSAHKGGPTIMMQCLKFFDVCMRVCSCGSVLPENCHHTRFICSNLLDLMLNAAAGTLYCANHHMDYQPSQHRDETQAKQKTITHDQNSFAGGEAPAQRSDIVHSVPRTLGRDTLRQCHSYIRLDKGSTVPPYYSTPFAVLPALSGRLPPTEAVTELGGCTGLQERQ